jgi:sugar/nucleoside kinase (ribokinase family)
MKKILGIGNALVDILTFIDNDKILDLFSLPKGSMQLVDSEKSHQVKEGTSGFPRSKASGGSAANTIHGLAMLGAETGFIGTVGKDETGDFFENDMKKAGVKTMLQRRDTETGTAVALISTDSERTFATHLGAAVELNAEDLDPDFFNDFDILYLEGYLIFNKPLVERACQIAKSKGMKVALDLASYNVVEAKLDDFRDLIEKYADIIFANEEEARAFTAMEPEFALKQIAEVSEIAVVKVGKEGSWIKRGEEILKVGTMEVNCIDTTGAGDLYASGFLFGYANDLSLDNCGLLGSLLAGHVISITGARMDDQMWEDIRSSKLSLFNGLVI